MKERFDKWIVSIKGDGRPQTMHPIYRILYNIFNILCHISMFVMVFAIVRSVFFYILMQVSKSASYVDAVTFPFTIISIVVSFLIFLVLEEFYFRYKQDYKIFKIKNK